MVWQCIYKSRSTAPIYHACLYFNELQKVTLCLSCKHLGVPPPANFLVGNREGMAVSNPISSGSHHRILRQLVLRVLNPHLRSSYWCGTAEPLWLVVPIASFGFRSSFLQHFFLCPPVWVYSLTQTSHGFLWCLSGWFCRRCSCLNPFRACARPNITHKT